jgi:hypothetical protein
MIATVLLMRNADRSALENASCSNLQSKLHACANGQWFQAEIHQPMMLLPTSRFGAPGLVLVCSKIWR